MAGSPNLIVNSSTQWGAIAVVYGREALLSPRDADQDAAGAGSCHAFASAQGEGAPRTAQALPSCCQECTGQVESAARVLSQPLPALGRLLSPLVHSDHRQAQRFSATRRQRRDEQIRTLQCSQGMSKAQQTHLADWSCAKLLSTRQLCDWSPMKMRWLATPAE